MTWPVPSALRTFPHFSQRNSTATAMLLSGRRAPAPACRACPARTHRRPGSGSADADGHKPRAGALNLYRRHNLLFITKLAASQHINDLAAPPRLGAVSARVCEGGQHVRAGMCSHSHTGRATVASRRKLRTPRLSGRQPLWRRKTVTPQATFQAGRTPLSGRPEMGPAWAGEWAHPPGEVRPMRQTSLGERVRPNAGGAPRRTVIVTRRGICRQG